MEDRSRDELRNPRPRPRGEQTGRPRAAEELHGPEGRADRGEGGGGVSGVRSGTAQRPVLSAVQRLRMGAFLFILKNMDDLKHTRV